MKVKLARFLLLSAFGSIWIQNSTRAHAQGPPEVIWEVPTPSGLANSVQGVGWCPGSSGRVAVGSTDRWVRIRAAANGTLVYSVLQPIRSGSADQTLFSSDAAYLAVHNSGGGLGYRVHRAADGAFIGMLTVTIDTNRIVLFAADAQLISAAGDGKLERWRLGELTVNETIGSGYDRTTTTFNFSPNGVYQSAATGGKITIKRRGDASTVRVLTGGALTGSTSIAFTPDSTGIAAYASNPNQVTLWRISDGAVLMRFSCETPQEGVTAVRFTPDGARLVTTGYLPFVDNNGLWQQKGIIRFWRVADGVLRNVYDQRTGIAVTSPIAWSHEAQRFAYGTYEGTVVVARTPSP